MWVAGEAGCYSARCDGGADMSALADLLAIPEVGRDEPWHIDPKDKDTRDEITRQAGFLRDAHIICPAVDIVAVPNAGRRSRWEQYQRTREGMRRGALDLFCTWSNGIGEMIGPGVAFLEFKDGREMPDADQRERLNLYYRQGHHCGVFRTAESALEFLRRAGAPFIDRQGL